MISLRQFIRYKDIVLYRTEAGIKHEARQNYLGFIWFFAEPAITTAVLYLAWTKISGHSGPDAVLAVLLGMVAWSWFESSVMMGATAIKAKFHVLNQFALPKMIFPLVAIFVNTWKAAFVFGVTIALGWFFKHPPNIHYLWLPVLALVQLVLIVGVTLPISIAVTMMNDLLVVVSSVFRLLFFLSGLFFGLDTVPDHLREAFFWNPMAVMIDSYRAVLLRDSAPDVFLIGRSFAVSMVFVVLGVALHAYYDKKILKLTNA